MRLDLNQLRTFVVVVETGGLTSAAERLNVSQAALSMQIKALQESLGLRLLLRTGRGMKLSEDGERVLAYARQTLSAADLLTKAAQALTQRPSGVLQAEPLAIGTILDPAFIRLGELLRGVNVMLPNFRPSLRHGVSGWVLKEVRAGRLDFGFYIGNADKDVFSVLPLAPLRYVVLAPRGWSARIKGADWHALAQLPWVWTPPESAHNRLLSPLFRSLNVRPQVVADVDQEASMLDLVRAGIGLSLAREDVAMREANHHGLVISRSHFLETTLSAIGLRSKAQNGVVKQLFDVVTGIWLERNK